MRCSELPKCETSLVFLLNVQTLYSGGDQSSVPNSDSFHALVPRNFSVESAVIRSRTTDFVTTTPPAGLGTDLATIKRLCGDDMEALDMVDRVTVKPKVHHDNVSMTAEHGNTKNYALRRLRKDRPDLHAQVLAGDLSPHAAAVEAGFRKQTMTVPAEPRAAVRSGSF